MLKLKFVLMIGFISASLCAQLELSWSQIIEGNGGDLFNDVTHSPDGGCVLIGSTTSNDGVFSDNHGNRDGYIAKYDDEGNLVWDYVFGGSDTENLVDIVTTVDGGYIITGSSSSSDGDLEGLSSASSLQELLIKINDDGEIEWVDKYSNGNVISIKTDSQGNIYTIAPFGSLANGNIRLSKYDASGIRLWSNTVGGSAIAERIDVVVDNDGFVYQLTEHLSTTNGNDFRVTKFDAQGEEIWTKTYGGNGSDGAFVIEIRGDRLLLGGITSSSTGDVFVEYGDRDAFILELDFDGSVVASTAYGGSGNDRIDDMKVIGDKVFISGASTSSDNDFTVPYPSSFDIFVAEVDLQGDIAWVEYSGGSANDLRSRLDLVNDSMLIMGYSTTSQDGALEGADDEPSMYIAYYDYQDLLSTDQTDRLPFTVYPNPTADKINIDLENYSDCQLEMYDAKGHRVLIATDLSDQSVSLEGIAQGLYYITIVKNNRILGSQTIFID